MTGDLVEGAGGQEALHLLSLDPLEHTYYLHYWVGDLLGMLVHRCPQCHNTGCLDT